VLVFSGQTEGEKERAEREREREREREEVVVPAAVGQNDHHAHTLGVKLVRAGRLLHLHDCEAAGCEALARLAHPLDSVRRRGGEGGEKEGRRRRGPLCIERERRRRWRRRGVITLVQGQRAGLNGKTNRHSPIREPLVLVPPEENQRRLT
jgi:hypothetical protein